MKGEWINIYSGDLPLRSWWGDSGNECEYIYVHARTIDPIPPITFLNRNFVG